MVRQDMSLDELLNEAAAGDQAALQELLVRHQQRLRQLIAVRIDPRLRRRLDPSDVLQEVLAQAWQELPDYLQTRPLPFYPWLRQLAWERLVKLQRLHIHAQKRSMTREERGNPFLSNNSALVLADCLFAKGSSPSNRALREERCLHVNKALGQLPENDRELLVMRYLEQLDNHEIAALLGISEGAVRTRHLRAIERLRTLLDPYLRANDS